MKKDIKSLFSLLDYGYINSYLSYSSSMDNDSNYNKPTYKDYVKSVTSKRNKSVKRNGRRK